MVRLASPFITRAAERFEKHGSVTCAHLERVAALAPQKRRPRSELVGRGMLPLLPTLLAPLLTVRQLLPEFCSGMHDPQQRIAQWAGATPACRHSRRFVDVHHHHHFPSPATPPLPRSQVDPPGLHRPRHTTAQSLKYVGLLLFMVCYKRFHRLWPDVKVFLALPETDSDVLHASDINSTNTAHRCPLLRSRA